MSESLIERMRQESTSDHMVPTTVRLPFKLEKEIREFCDENSIKLSIVIRECIERGWRGIGRELHGYSGDSDSDTPS